MKESQEYSTTRNQSNQNSNPALQGNSFVVVLSFRCQCVSVTLHLTCVHIILVRFGLLSGHLLKKAAHSVDNMFCLYFDYL